ncbi:unnamed protein product, partial [Rotaria sp. Silwood2]
MSNSKSINDILLCDDNERLEHLIQIFAKYQMAGKRYEAKAWHAYFRRIAINPVIFYQHNATLFYEDNQYDHETFQVMEPTCIHGDLHIGQFQYYFDDVNNERVLRMIHHKKIIAPFTWDLKRLATNLVLVAYYQGFSDTEIIEILHVFIRQYIKNVTTRTGKINLCRKYSDKNEQYNQLKSCLSHRQISVIGSTPIQHNMHDIDWKKLDTVASFIIFAEQFAIVVANSHCQPPVSISPTQYLIENNAEHCTHVIQTALSSKTQQQELINDICLFSMIYAEIAERDHRLFFKHFRNERIFNGINVLNRTRIPHPLADARSLSILIVGGGIGGMATALSFARAGIRVHLFEKKEEFGEVGAGMQLAPNCSRLLDRLGVLKQIQSNAVFPKQIVWMDALTGQRLTAIDLGAKYIEAFDYPYIVVHRADLFDALYQACLENSLIIMETNRAVTSVDERPKSVMVECADGTRYDCNMVIAADGLWSSLRKFVCDDGAP